LRKLDIYSIVIILLDRIGI